MGSLKPGATYIYERNGNVLYGREQGTNDRFVVGYNDPIYSEIASRYKNEKIWQDIQRLSETNETLKKSLDQLIMLYNLIKNQGTEVPHHPV